MWSPKGVVGFRIRVNIYDNHDRHGVIVTMMESMMVREIDMKMLVPRMAPPPSQGVQR